MKGITMSKDLVREKWLAILKIGDTVDLTLYSTDEVRQIVAVKPKTLTLSGGWPNTASRAKGDTPAGFIYPATAESRAQRSVVRENAERVKRLCTLLWGASPDALSEIEKILNAE